MEKKYLFWLLILVSVVGMLSITGCQQTSIREASTIAEGSDAQQLLAVAGRAWKNEVGMSFVRIPPGSFVMGSPDSEIGREENERMHRVELTRGYYLQTTEVTQAQWRAVMGNNPSHFLNCGDDCPVEQVSWHDIQQFMDRLNAKAKNKHYRLPLESEWEYAARAQSSTAFANGDRTSQDLFYDKNLEKVGWYVGNSQKSTHPVAKKEPNAWGLYDMHGNVREWNLDWRHEYPFGVVVDPEDSEGGVSKVRRGGSWNLYTRYCRSAHRQWTIPATRDASTGFRVLAIDVEEIDDQNTLAPVTSWELLFAYDSVQVVKQSQPLLDQIAAHLVMGNLNVFLEGYASNEGGEDHNQILSEQRTAAIKSWLISKGISADRIVVRSYGGGTARFSAVDAKRSLDRRVVVSLK